MSSQKSPSRWQGSRVLNTVDLLKEVVSAVSRANLQLEALQLEDVVGVWTNLWHQAGAGVRMGKVKACSGRFPYIDLVLILSLQPLFKGFDMVGNACAIKTLRATAGDTSTMDGK